MKLRPIGAALMVPLRGNGAFLQSTARPHGRIAALAMGANGCPLRRIYRSRSCDEWQKRYASSSASAAARKQGDEDSIAPQSLAKTARSKAAKAPIPKKQKQSTTVPIPLPKEKHTTVPIPPPASKHNATIPILAAKEKLNLPAFAYAPDISVPARKADQSFFSYAYNAGRAYLSFYKTGISNVREASKLAKQLRAKAAQSKGKHVSAVLTRAEWQLVRRSRRDILRLPAFGALIMLLGEWLPLVVLYITPVIPEACRIPQQVNRSLRKLEDRRQDRLRRVRLDAPQLMGKGEDHHQSSNAVDALQDETANFLATSEAVRAADARAMSRFELVFCSARYDCHTRIWDWIFLYPPTWWLRRSVGRELEYLRRDDEVIARDGGWEGLGEKEVKRACVERGISVIGKSEGEVRASFARWWDARV